MSTVSILDQYDAILQDCIPVFGQRRSHGVWSLLVLGWLLTVLQRTIIGMYQLAGPEHGLAHDAFHRLLRVTHGSLTQLFRVLAQRVVALLPEDAAIPLVADDTLAHHIGSHVVGAGWFRDAVRSTGTKTVYAHGLNLVILAVRVPPPWGGAPIALPIQMRVHEKGGDATPVALLAAMLQDVRAWFPHRQLSLVVDGAYASSAAKATTDVMVTSRMRQDAKIFDLPPEPLKHKRGPKPKKGARLPNPRALAADPALRWKYVKVRRGRRTLIRQVFARQVLWPSVRPQTPVLLVIVRDPRGKEADDFFFTTAVERPTAAVVTEYGDRWPIEVTIRDSKQQLGVEEPQCWQGEGPARAAGLGLWLYSLVWFLYLTTHATTPVETTPWYPYKRAPSFADALTAVRTALWARKLAMVSLAGGPAPIINQLIAYLARAA